MIKATQTKWPGLVGIGGLMFFSVFCLSNPVLAEVPSRKGTYFLQLNAYKIESNAHSFVQKYEAKGYPIYIDHGVDEPWHKVKMGPFPSWEKAQKTAHDLKLKENLSPLILISVGDTTSIVETLEAQATEELKLVKNDGSQAKPAEGNVDGAITRFLAWKLAWQSKDLSAYLSFYSASFHPARKSQSLDAWKTSRARALSYNEEISIEVGEIQINPEKSRVEMRFIQKYRSGNFSDTGHKTLTWVFEQGEWKIASERWLPI